MKIAYNPITAEVLTTAPANNDITFDLRGLNIFVRGVKFKGTDTTYSVFKKHTSSSGGGYNGLVPVPSYTSTNTRFLREDGTWSIPAAAAFIYTQLTNQDLDDYLDEGKWYYAGGGNSVTNKPSGVDAFELYVGRNASGYRYQKLITSSGIIWFRYYDSTAWKTWVRWYTDQNTDQKVLQSATTTANFRPVILGYTNTNTPSDLSANVTQQVYTTTTIYAQPSTGSLWANKLYSGGKPVLTEHQSLANYVTLNTTQIITGSKTFSNPINSSFISSTHLDANKGRTIINSTANAGSYTMLFKGNSTNGYFTHGVYQGKYLLQYTTKSTVDAGTNSVTKSVILLDESGNSQFSGSIYAPKFIGSLQGNADSATKLTISAGSSSLPVYFLEGKPLACSPSSLFSNLSNSGNNISVTVAGQNRTLTINYANEANKLYSYGLPDSRSDKGGWYCKIASISLTSRFSSKSALLCITDEYTITSNYPRYGFIYVKVQQQEKLGTSPNITLRISGSLTTSLVTGILTLSSSSSKLDIYLKEDQQYYRGYVSFIHGKEDIRTNSQELIQTLPQGTIINSQYGDISNQTLSLLNSRKINGTSFNGTTDITTSYWGPTRTITLTGAVTGTVSTNGSGNIIINTTYDTNNISDLDSRYVNITGDTMTGNLTFSDTGTSSYPIESKGIKWNGGTDSASIFYRLQSSDQGNLVFRTGDDTNCYFIWENAKGSSLTQWMTLKGNTLTVSNLNGNASTTTKLQTARQINGTNFNGTANITTSYWGTARTLTIGNSAKSVNGSENVSWTLSEIGAAASRHNHGTLHDNFTVTLANTTVDSGWSMINSSYNGFLLKSIRTQASAPNWTLGDFAAGICFGGGNTKGVISVAYSYARIRVAGGNGSKPVWSCDLWHNGNFNPSNYSLTSHNHDDRYVNVTGDTMTGRLTFNDGGIATSTTTSLQLGMYTPTHIYLQTAGTLYYSPKSGTNYRIWHAGNFNPNNYMRVTLANGYYGMVAPQGDISAWIRTTSSGILPFQSGTSTDGHCGIGTSTWYFNSAYIQNIHSHRTEASDGFYQQSDIRLKENIQKITSMSNIELVEFMWKKDKKKSYGVIAQQVEKYFPELVNIDKETGYKSVNYDAILIIKIAQLENKIKQLESKLL